MNGIPPATATHLGRAAPRGRASAIFHQFRAALRTEERWCAVVMVVLGLVLAVGSHARPTTGLLRAGAGEPEMDELHDQMEGDLRLRRLSESTSVNYLGCVARFEAWHGRSADELGRAEVLAFLTWLVRERGISASTQAGYLAALCFLYRVTLERPEVVAGIPWPRSGARLPAVLSRSEIEAIFGATPLLKHRAAFLAGYAAGLRVSEVVHLQIGDIDSDRGVLHVRAGKGNRDREALLPPVLLSELRSYRLKGGSQGPYLFPNRNRQGQPMGRGALTAAFRRAVDRAGVHRPLVSFRSLRVAFATHMLEDGVALPVIQQLMGHSSMRTTARYLRVTSPMLLGVRSPAEALRLPPPVTSRSAAESGGQDPQAALLGADRRGRGPRADGRWYWQAACAVAGKRKTIWSGWATRAEAERATCEARAALPTDLSAPAAEAKVEAAAGLTVAAILEQWIEDCRTRPYIATRTLGTYTDAAKNLTRLIGGYRLTEISIRETQGYLTARYNEGLRVRTAWFELGLLRTAWRWGKAARLHEEPLHLPAKTSVRLEKIRTPRPTREEAWATWDALRELGAPEWLVRTYLLGLVTGARTGEIYVTRVGDFDLDAGTVQIGRDLEDDERTKTGAREVYLDPAAVETLRPYVAGREPGERYIGDRARSTLHRTGNYLQAACAAAGAPVHPLYGLRRAATDAYYDAGAEPAEEAAAMGHCIEVAQRKYRRIDAKKARAAARKVALGARPTPPTPEPEPAEGPEDGGKVIPIERAKGRTG